MVAVILLVVGALITAGVISYDREETVAKLGPLELTATQEKKPAPMIGYVLLGAGALALVVAFVGKK